MNDTDKIMQALLALHADMKQGQARVEKRLDQQGKDIQVVKEVVKFVDMKVDAGNNKIISSVAELKEELDKKADKADVLTVGVKVDKLKHRIEGMEDDLDLPQRDKN